MSFSPLSNWAVRFTNSDFTSFDLPIVGAVVGDEGVDGEALVLSRDGEVKRVSEIEPLDAKRRVFDNTPRPEY